MAEPDDRTILGPYGRPVSTEKSDHWVIVRSISAVVASVAAASIPVVVTIVSNQYTAAVENAERQAQFIEIAVGVLSEPSGDELAQATREPLREWAVRVINLNATDELQFDERSQRLLIEGEALLKREAMLAEIEALEKLRALEITLDGLEAGIKALEEPPRPDRIPGLPDPTEQQP